MSMRKRYRQQPDIYTSMMQEMVESVDWYRFLERARLPVAGSDAADLLRDKSILVTGAGGSIGSSLALRLNELSPRKLILLEASESHLHELQLRLDPNSSGTCDAACYLGSVRDEALLDEIFVQHRPEWIYHAAAHKHVSLLEDHPLAGLTNNVLGTEAVSARAESMGSRMVLLSTDKAAAPASMMGATKRVAELIVLANGGVVVRLGNVLASRGSVVETFTRQIAHGGPVTITDPEAARFWLTVEESCELLISAVTEVGEDAGEAVLLVPELAQRRTVGELAMFMMKELAPHQEISVKVTGLKAGEKKLEVLWTDEEDITAISRGGLRRICTHPMTRTQLYPGLHELRQTIGARDLQGAVATLESLVPGYFASQRVWTSSASSGPVMV